MTGEGLSRDKKIGVMVIVLLYFLVGFMLIVILLSKYLGPGDAGLIGILYLAAGWLVLYRWKGIFRLMRIRH